MQRSNFSEVPHGYVLSFQTASSAKTLREIGLRCKQNWSILLTKILTAKCTPDLLCNYPSVYIRCLVGGFSAPKVAGEEDVMEATEKARGELEGWSEAAPHRHDIKTTPQTTKWKRPQSLELWTIWAQSVSFPDAVCTLLSVFQHSLSELQKYWT
eukprot:3294217-Amphidinium_carterae.1